MATAPATKPTVTGPQRPERVPPQDLDAEMALLGSMMMSRDAIAEIVAIIGRSDGSWFYVPAHQRLFEVLLDLYDDPTKAIDLIVVSDELRRRDLLEFVGGQDYMIQLAESFAEWANAEHYAKIVRDKGLLRDVIRCAGEISDAAFHSIEPAKDILDLAERKIFQVTERRVTGHAVEIREAVARLAKQLELGHRGMTGLESGFLQLDELTSGFQPGDFIVVAGRPSMGKTALGLTMAYHGALRCRKPIAFFSMEMSVDQLAQRLICSHTGIDAQKLRKRMLSEGEMHQVLDACADFEHAPLYVDDTPGMTALELRSKARRLKQMHDIQAVYVDYLQLMHMPDAESRQVEISGISRNMKSLGRELNIPIIAMAQLNRMAEGRADKKPIMSDLRESGAIEQDADVILLIHREEYYHPDKEEAQNKADLILAKQRNGPTGMVELSFNKKLTLFGNPSLVADPPTRGAGYEEVPF